MPLTSEELKQLFSQQLISLMEKHNINQVELSKVIGVSESTVGKWVLQKALPRMGVIQQLADYFHVGKSYFLEPQLSEEGYYTDPEVAAYAEELRTNSQLKMLFSASKDLTKEQMKQAYDYVKFLKQQSGEGDD